MHNSVVVGAIHELPLQKDFPAGWVWKTIGEVCKFEKGKKPKNSGHRSDKRTVPYINIKAFETGIPEEYAESGNYPMCSKHDVLIVWDGARSGLAGSGVSGYIGSTLSKVWSHETDNKYLFYFLKSQYGYINTNTKGVGIPHVDSGILNAIEIPIAPLDQQKSIVAEIEKQFSRLDEAVTALKRIQANLKRYKASVLKAAVEGKLTEQWRKEHPDVSPASELLKRILAERRKKWGKENPDKKYKEPAEPDTTDLPKLKKGWIWAGLSQVALFQNGRSFPSKEYSLQGVKLLRPGNLYADGLVKWTDNNTKKLPDKWATKYPDYLIGGGELIMNLTAQSLRDEFLGRTCTTAEGERCLLNQRLARISPLSGLNPHFLLWLLKAKIFRDFVDTLNTGSLIQHMFTSDLAQFNLPLPPQVEQEAIIHEIERCLSVAMEIEAAVEINLKRAERLRQSILKEAFSGKLI